MESIHNFYINSWNTAFDGDEAALDRKLGAACDVISCSVNDLDIFSVPYYLLDNVYKAICVQADESEDIPAENYSYKIGNFSVSQKSENKKTGLCEKARGYLINTGLLRNIAAVI
jgi:hypothetical protein